MNTLYLVNGLGASLAAVASLFAFIVWRRVKSADAIAADPNAEQGTSLLRRLVAPVALQMRPTEQEELESLKDSLLRAGRRSRDAIDRFLEERVIYLFGGLFFAVLNVQVVGGFFGFLLSCGSMIAGICMPKWLVTMRTVERREAINAALPSAVDLLTTCIDAGLSLEHALARVARDMELVAPTLAEELQISAKELEAGVTLPNAMRRLARRVGLDDLSALCGVVAQAHGLGAPVGETLREYAQSSRRQRTSMLEERAGKVAAQLTIPLAVFFLPAGLVTILGPSIVQLVRVLQ